jgi:uncharacterized protein (DUF1501 family)
MSKPLLPTSPLSLLNRRQFLCRAGAFGLSGFAAPWANASNAPTPNLGKLVVMVYLKGGNDAYNTLVPFTESRYYRLRPSLGIKRDQTIQLTNRHGLNRALSPLMSLWQDRELAILQGIGQEDVTNQHYRDAETQFTGASADEFYSDGWVTRAWTANSRLRAPAIDALAFGDLDIREADPMGPFRGGNQQLGVVNMLYPQEWLTRRQVNQTAFLTTAKARASADTFALLQPQRLKTTFPTDSFGNALQATVELAAAGLAPPVVHITLNAEDGDQHNAFDTHWDQAKYHGPTLERLANGLAAFRSGMREIGRWNDTLLYTYDEFGRSPKENEKQGTHHGWAGVHFVAGGRVNGGFYGEPMPVVDVFQIDGPPPTIDFRALYTTVIEQWWGGNAAGVFKKPFKSLELIKA